MSASTPTNYDDLIDKLTHEISEWEHSPYYLEDKELFNLEQFLLDHNAPELIERLERSYGTPLNEEFWSSSLTYQRLKRARQDVKAMDADQERRREEYARSLEEGKRAWQEWLRESSLNQRRSRLRVIRGRRNSKQ